ncbi:MAG: ribosome maturation factor RimM [Dethiobacteria bacterium]|jgi:16S rRNA processing protein RimM
MPQRPKMVTIGKILSPFGIKGEVKVYPYSDFPERCYTLDKVKLEGKEGSLFKTVVSAFLHQNLWIMHFENCDTREDAQKLRGMLVQIPPSERVPLPAGSYYYDEIIGLEAFTTGGLKIGLVKDIIKTGSNDVYVIEQGDTAGDKKDKKKDLLVPALKDIVKEINLEKGYLLLEPIPGLLD